MRRQPDTTTIEKITTEEFHTITYPFIGLPISHIWCGGGASVFFELGELSERNRKRRDGSFSTSLWGEATINFEIGWRVERPQSVFFGTSSEEQLISSGLNKLQGLKVLSLSLQGRLPELIVELSDKIWLHSFSTWEGQPEWALFFNKPSGRQWLMSKRGNIVIVKSRE